MQKVKIENIHTREKRKLWPVKCKIMVHKRSVRRFPIMRCGVVRKVFGGRVVFILSRIEMKDGKDHG